jgi:hypothetical protein
MSSIDHRLRRFKAAIVAVAMLAGATHAFADVVPRDDVTPGAIRNLTVQKICSTRWGKDRRAVTAKMKREVFANYGMTGNGDSKCIPDKRGRRCEIDHRVPRSLAGKDAVINLWAQPFGTHPWNAASKDRLEALIHKRVCAGKITLKHGQAIFLGDWTKGYRQHIGAPDEGARSGRGPGRPSNRASPRSAGATRKRATILRRRRQWDDA